MPHDDYHIPVLAREVMAYLVINPGGIYVDATTGGGGHSQLILSEISDQGRVIGFDLDQDACLYAGNRLAEFPNHRLFNVGFDQVDFVLESENIRKIDGILYDLGLSSYQLDGEKKGFAFMSESPLDMRFNRNQKLSAWQVVNEYREDELFRIIRDYGEEHQAGAISRKIVEVRSVSPINTTNQLASVIEGIVPGKFLTKTLARVFQAIRIEVNGELERLQKSLKKVFPFLKKGGRIVVISYHSLEDRIVKTFFKEHSKDCVCPPEFPVCHCGHKKDLIILTKKVITPSAEEISFNPRSRSAKLRAAQKI